MTERNDPCPCGSGKKYKKCCAEKAAAKASRLPMIATLAVVAVGAAAIVTQLINRADQEAQAGRPVAQQSAAAPAPVLPSAPKAQPPGPAPAGKVWSKDHGHWHDANSSANSPIKLDMENLPRTAPAGAPSPANSAAAAAAGMVWSAEHGHWHKASGATPARAAVEPAKGVAPGPLAASPTVVRVLGQTVDLADPNSNSAAPKRVWSAEHGHWHTLDGKPGATEAREHKGEKKSDAPASPMAGFTPIPTREAAEQPKKP